MPTKGQTCQPVRLPSIHWHYAAEMKTRGKRIEAGGVWEYFIYGLTGPKSRAESLFRSERVSSRRVAPTSDGSDLNQKQPLALSLETGFGLTPPVRRGDVLVPRGRPTFEKKVTANWYGCSGGRWDCHRGAI
jgi:hypothetical protein